MIRTGSPAIAALLLASIAQGADALSSASSATATKADARTDSTPAQVHRADVAAGVYELAYSARQNAVFVAASGGFGEDAEPSRLLRLDPATLRVQHAIALPHKGFGVALDDATDRLYVGHGMDASISVIDTAENRVLDTVRLETRTVDKDGKENTTHHLRELVLDPSGHRLYAPGLGFDGSVLFVVDTRTFTLEKTLDGFGPVATGIALDIAGKRLFVSNFASEIITVDTRTLEIAGRFASGVEQPLNLVWDGAGKRLLATDQGLAYVRTMQAERMPGFESRHPGNRVAVLDPDAGTVVGSLATGEGPIALLLDAPRSRLYVTNRGSGSVSVFDYGRQALIETIALPAHPNSLALAADNGTLFVSVKNDSDAKKGALEGVARLTF